MTYEEFEQRYQYDPEEDYLNEGGFGTVFKAFDTKRKRHVVIKESKVNPKHKHFTLQREVELAREIEGHENIAHYIRCYRFKLGRTEFDYAILKYYEYGNINDVLNNRNLSFEDKTELIKGILKGIQHLHNEGIIHRDLKAGNVLVDYQNGKWVAKIADFGLSRMTQGDISVSNSSVGISYQYAAPEQVLGEKISQSTDIWAVGILIYKIMTGDLPYTSAKSEKTAQQMDIAGQIRNAPIPAKIKQIPSPYREMVKQCLIKNKDKRPNTITPLLRLLENKEEVVTVVPEIIIPTKTVIVKENKFISDFCEMVFVEGGSFMMGDENIENAKPVHKVTLDSFHIGKYPVTQKQWVEIMGDNPSYFKGENRPVERVSWDDTQEFIKKLNQKTGLNYRLPTESEWEYAARGGQKSKGYQYAGSNDAEKVAWYYYNSGVKKWHRLYNNKKATHSVGQKKSNELGIYDMSGNVWEWCEDTWHSNYKNAPTNNSVWGNEKDSNLVIRGGSWSFNASLCRVSYRSLNNPDSRNDYVGFRLVSQ